MLKVGIVGYGYWGPNILRNFAMQENAKVTAVCDLNKATLHKIAKLYGGITTTTDYKDITRSNEIDIVCVVTPVSTHYEIALDALLHGKHIFVEKALTSKSGQAEGIIELADKKGLKTMVDHTFLFTGSVRKIKEIMSDNLLGEIYYYDSTRVNLGLFQPDVNVVWDLAPHDFSVMDFVLDEKPVAVSSIGIDHFGTGHEDLAYITAYFKSKLLAHFNVNWISPAKVRTTYIGGNKRMLVWNDIDVDEKIKVYDKGIDVKNRESAYDRLVQYRSGDMHGPQVDTREALSLEVEYFIDCILKNKKPINDAVSGLRVVKMLEAATKSMKLKGKVIKLI